MDQLYTTGIDAIHLIQRQFEPYENELILLSKIFDPRYAFLIFSPLVYSMDAASGITLIWTTIAAEFVNQILKWLLMSDRPYWWVRSTDVYNKTGVDAPNLKQFPLTCETGPGSPSGHAMLTAAVWFVLISAVLRHYQKHKLPTLGPLRVFLWLFYVCSIIGVTISRLYLSAHFPHQCVLGAGLGLLVAVVVYRSNLRNIKLATYVVGTVFMLTVVAATYATLILVLKVDPGWTIAKAVKWCLKKEHVHMDTTPFFSIMRYTGFFLGTGIGLNAAPEPLVVRPANLSRPNESMKVRSINFLKAVISIALIHALNLIRIPSGNLPVFYALSFLMNTVQPILFICIVPKIISLLIPQGKQRLD